MSEAIFAYTSTERYFRSLIVRCESRKKAQNLLGNIEAREAVRVKSCGAPSFERSWRGAAGVGQRVQGAPAIGWLT